MNNQTKSLETEFITYSIQQGVLFASYKTGTNINLEIARQLVKSRIQFTENHQYPALVNSQGVVSMDKSARDYLASSEGIQGLKAVAILVNSPFHSFLGNFFLWVNKTKMPVRIFTQEDQALKWLKKYVS